MLPLYSVVVFSYLLSFCSHQYIGCLVAGVFLMEAEEEAIGSGVPPDPPLSHLRVKRRIWWFTVWNLADLSRSMRTDKRECGTVLSLSLQVWTC